MCATENKRTMSDAMAYANNYHNYLWEKISPELSDSIMEVGVGFGQYTHRMLSEGKAVLGIDISLEHLNSLKESIHSSKLTLLQVDINNPKDGYERSKAFSPTSIVCMNLLEHIRDDAKALEFMHSIAGNNCNLIMVLPAMPCLFNSLDREAGHYRRYGLKGIKRILKLSGWEIKKIKYINMPGIIGWIAAGFLSKNKTTALNAPSTNILIRLYDRIFITLSQITDIFFQKLLGLSLFVVAVKKV